MKSPDIKSLEIKVCATESDKSDMKSRLSLLFLCLVLGNSLWAEGDCVQCEKRLETTSPVVDELLGSLESITDSLYEKVLDLKVKFDGSGDLSVSYDKNGRPVLLKLRYKKIEKVLTFDQIEKGQPLFYEKKDRPELAGKAISIEKGSPFKTGDAYMFRLLVRKSIDPQEFDIFEMQFTAKPKEQRISIHGEEFNFVVISPGVEALHWDGTFKSVTFENKRVSSRTTR